MLGGTIDVGRERPSAAPTGAPTGRDDDVALATRGARWVRRWDGWAHWELTNGMLVLAAAAVTVDVATAWAGWSLGYVGRFPVSLAIPLAVLLALRIGIGAVGFSGATLFRWREFAVGAAILVPIAVGGYVGAAGTSTDAAGLLVAAAGEELVYRFAMLLLVGAAAARVMGRDWRRPARWGNGPGATALVAAGVVFSLLPGHVAQMHAPISTLPFASLSLVLGWAVLRSGALWPVIVTHLVLNLATFGSVAGGFSAGGRMAICLAALVGLLVAADVAGRRAGTLRPVPTTIDLTAVSGSA
ncbi:MAG TPA: CPBP family intramembrane glutamic endopeptidase [Acidimicrobiia bacterium]|nr:CPBP family intramembrane glutamic endopeptidase [Acidimicrobiia bacterium]